MSGPVRSVYVHAPFCERRCFYCDFAVDVDRSPDSRLWLAALSGELAAVRSEGRFRLSHPLETLYVGGGTPSLLGPEAMTGLARLLGSGVPGDREGEWTAEANPESLTGETARGWRRAGVNRLSLGVQSFHPPTLAWMGRLHTPERAVEAVRLARAAGISNISIDLIFGVPAHLHRPWGTDLDRAIALDVPHISLYGLTVEKGTPLGRAVADSTESVAGEQRYRDEFLEASRRMTEAGYLHYEVSNFALPGCESRHNRVYWSGMPYLGLGNGAHSFLPGFRRWNLREWAAYRQAAAEGRLPVQGEESLGPEARRLEQIWLGLRTRGGLPATLLSPGERVRIARWIGAGLAVGGEAGIRLTPEGWLLLDRLVVELSDALDSPALRFPPAEPFFLT